MTARENPFAPARLERVLKFDPQLIGTSWDEIESRWESLDRRACVIGRHGAGKSTFLDAFAGRLQLPVKRLFFNRGRPRMSDADRESLATAAGAILVVDGDEHLPWPERRELARVAEGAAGFLSARHRARSLPVLLELRADGELARALLERAAPQWLARFEPGIPKRLRRHRGNLRELWLGCFDELAGR